jgi:hypothetical protein
MRMTEQDEYTVKLSGMTDDELVKEAEQMVWLSAYAANNPRSAYHWKCDQTYDEAKRREKPWLYQKGWNNAYESAGHELSDANIAAAEAPNA